MNSTPPLIAPFHKLFHEVFSGPQNTPTVDQYNSFFRGRGKSTHFTTTNFFKFLQDQALQSNCQSWYWLFFCLPPLLFSLPPNGGHHTQHMTPVLGERNGHILHRAFLQAFQEKLTDIPLLDILNPGRDGLEKLLEYSMETPLEKTCMVRWLTEMYRFNSERYGSPKEKNMPGTYNEWQMLKEAFYKELIYPVLQLYCDCLRFSDLCCSHPETMYEAESDPTSDLPPFSFDYMIYDRVTKREILAVVCLDLLMWHSDKFTRPEERTIPTDMDSIIFDNTAKFRQIKRYLLQGRAKSVLVTDFESALLVRVEYDFASVWDFNSMGLEVLPLSVNFISGMDPQVPLRLAIFCCIEFEYSEQSKEAERVVVQFARNRRALGCWRMFQTPAFQWHKVTTGRYFQEWGSYRGRFQRQNIAHNEHPPAHSSRNLSGPMVYPVLSSITTPVVSSSVMLPLGFSQGSEPGSGTD